MWWLDVLVVLLVIAGLLSFLLMVRNRTRRLSSHTDRTAEDMYDQFAEPPTTQRRFIRRQGRPGHQP